MSQIAAKSRFLELCHRLHIDMGISQKWFTIIVERYGEHLRKYHTLQHLEDMFFYYDKWKPSLSKPDDVLLAIYFHDIVYDPTANDNEEKSIQLFEDFISDSCPDMTEVKRSVIYLIQTTITHLTAFDEKNDDLNYFLDFDMAILGSDEKDYREYADNIRKEYKHHSDDVFNTKRIAVLENFLKRPHIFNTDSFRDLYEDKARLNITEEIKRLKAK
ncbi:hypothetical protein SNE40_004639 [Patella caerulea]|uniref:Metal-dependent HD superfamily phosphohydrolase n=1 Tax=Patella caerulea TaxID=87958 RepID=A0AAN8QCN2_PATCE